MTTATVRKPATANIIQSVVIGFFLTAGTYFIGLQAHWITSLNWIEVAAVFTSYISTYLCLVERRFNYPVGAISSVFYAWLFFDYHLVASMIVNLYLIAYLWYGYWRWGKDAVTRPVSFVRGRLWPVYLLVAGAGYALVYGVATALGGTFLWTDSLILVLTLLAQVLLDNKKWENWTVWLIMDVFATYEYYATGLFLVGFQYIFFTLNTVVGAYMWYRSWKKNRSRKTITYEAYLPTREEQLNGDGGYLRVSHG